MITISRKLFATAAFGSVLLYVVLLYCDAVADPVNHFKGKLILSIVIMLFVFSTKTYLRLQESYKWYDLLIMISIVLTWMVMLCAMFAMYIFTLGWS